MSLIDATYFKNDINLPSETYGNLTGFITKFEKELLIRLFGYGLYKLISSYNAETSEQRIKDIVEGKEFTDGDYTYKWNGLVNTEKVSIIAYYVYYYVMRDRVSQSTTTGEIIPGHENAEAIEIQAKVQSAWVKMLELIGETSQGSWTYQNSLYNFMAKYNADYSEWQYKPIGGTVNMFDL